MSDISAQPTQGYFMLPARSVPPHERHMLGGDQHFSGAVSPNSGRRLLQLALINTSDQRVELQIAPFEGLPLLYSWTCDIHHGVFTYGVGPNKVDLLDFQQGQTYSDFPYPHYPDAFAPQFVDLSPIGVREQQIILELNNRNTRRSSPHRRTNLDQPRHQVGGVPRLMQDVLNPKCPRCAGPMPLFAAIANDNGTPQGFTGNSHVQVIYHLCRACWVVTCYNLCD